MSGDDPYKAERTTQERSLRYRALFPRCVRGVVAYGTLVAPRWRRREGRAGMGHLH